MSQRGCGYVKIKSPAQAKLGLGTPEGGGRRRWHISLKRLRFAATAAKLDGVDHGLGHAVGQSFIEKRECVETLVSSVRLDDIDGRIDFNTPRGVPLCYGGILQALLHRFHGDALDVFQREALVDVPN